MMGSDGLHSRNSLSFGMDREYESIHKGRVLECYNKARDDSHFNLSSELESLSDQYYDRRLVLGNERQTMLYGVNALVLGSGPLAQLIAGSLAGIGVGNIHISGTSDSSSGCYEPLAYDRETYMDKMDSIKRSLMLINPSYSEWMEDRQSASCSLDKAVEELTKEYRSQIIIDATNSPERKKEALAYAIDSKTPLISASSSLTSGSISCFIPSTWYGTDISADVCKMDELMSSMLFDRYLGSVQGPIPSGLIAGLAVDELRKLIFKYSINGNDNNIPNGMTLIYNVLSYSKNQPTDDFMIEPASIADRPRRRALIAGVGALGNFVAMALSTEGYDRIDTLDCDIVEDSNLSRQLLLRGMIGHMKAEVVSQRIKEINPLIESDPLIGKVGDPSLLMGFPEQAIASKIALNIKDKANGVHLFSEKDLLDRGYDTVFGCFDNKFARIWLNRFCHKNGLLYIDGGTDPYKGQLAVSYPGRTLPVGEQIDLMNAPERVSCRFDPSSVISNAVIGSAMVGEAKSIDHLLMACKGLMKESDSGIHMLKYKSESLNKIRFIRK